MKKRRKIKKKSLLILIILILIVLSTILLLSKNQKNSFENIGYSKQEIEIIDKLSNNEKNIILNNEYSKSLKDIITNKNYNKDNLKEYIELSYKYSNIEGIIKYVNNYSDNNIELDDATLDFISKEYFIVEYLDRYLKYYEDNKDLELNEIITRINSNLDYTFYDDATKADISKGMYTLVNKFYYLEEDFKPENIITVTNEYTRDTARLNKLAYENFVKMADAAKEEGLTLKITTGYRDYYFQRTLYNNYVRSDGVKLADTYSARPGFSEHQLGYSADLTNKNIVGFDKFEYTEEYKWLQDNAYKYGFIMRYPKDKEYITGYQFESWHYRYVGNDIAKYIYENNITYEEYYAYFLR